MRHVGKIFALLLDFAALSEKSRREFLTMMNEFLLMSPVQRRRVLTEWKNRVDGNSHDLPGDSSQR
ncbi:hypothetical protein CEQ23_35755 [Burkholderia cepacia]|uniref:Uncharacterized protein n=1 Tax=Burkholderia cepacia TaxID=292 RepID=A0ABM6P7H3_BURCE|nr:hypothetical protein [Burkholderia cepacia]AIO27555.1 hypothetical protein DM41_4106 [Burkholderia cepacia ATCC 25416]ALK21254.1 hypothetical protein APZ15_26160 [Burkholderia cepacia ATCC 25416]ASE98676.1 hypothetical protein CEQ23_35755 [Burkholderia cepacia]ATF83063.1 hypothetical protein CO711_38540 [Burkholderia cepacia]MCA8468952.1 hypothetical protein [Burkholderia cepacia]